MMDNALSTVAEAQKMQRYTVAKSNEFILHSRYDLSVMEQRILACVISLLDSRPESLRGGDSDSVWVDDDGKVWVDFNINTFCELCKIEKRGSSKYLKEVTQKLRNRSFWMETSKGISETCSWIDKVMLKEEQGILSLNISNDLKPYLLNLSSDFTAYKLPMVLRFNSRYTNIVFDLIYAEYGRSYKSSGSFQITVDEMRSRVQIKKDEKTNKLVNQNISFKDLRVRILEPTIEEINKFTDIMVSVDYIKTGRKIDRIQFNYKPKTKNELSFVPPFSENKIENL